RLTLSVMAIAVLGSGIQDAAAALRLSKLGSRRESRLPDQTTRSHRVQNVDAESERNEPPRRARPGVLTIPAGMKVVLTAAGVYNLVWGSWVILSPAAVFRWAGMPPTNYPQIWQCVGMIVGVYGIGYLIAARDPFRHWPIVFVGLLGKVLGPVG